MMWNILPRLCAAWAIPLTAILSLSEHVQGQIAASNAPAPLYPARDFPVPTLNLSEPMTMLSTSSGREFPDTRPSQWIYCRTSGVISNAQPWGRIIVKGVVTIDVVSGGKILIAAGSKVSGIAHVDSDSGRIESDGTWSIVTDDRELHARAELRSAQGGFHGVEGAIAQLEPSEKQAVTQEDSYYSLADKTPFVLSINGDVSVSQLTPLKTLE
jgi:hypothetical protein